MVTCSTIQKKRCILCVKRTPSQMEERVSLTWTLACGHLLDIPETRYIFLGVKRTPSQQVYGHLLNKPGTKCVSVQCAHFHRRRREGRSTWTLACGHLLHEEGVFQLCFSVCKGAPPQSKTYSTDVTFKTRERTAL